MNATLSYTEQILAQMHARALRGVVLALVFSLIVHLGVTAIQLGGDSFSIRFDAPTQSSDTLQAQLKLRPAPAPVAQPAATAATPAPAAAPRESAPVLRDRAQVNLVDRESLRPITPSEAEPVSTEAIPMPAPLPEPVTRRFETDRSPASTRVERSERLPNVPTPVTVPPIELKPLPPLEIAPAKREPVAAQPPEGAKPVVPPVAPPIAPTTAPTTTPTTADAPPVESARPAASDPTKAAPAEVAKEATPTPAPASTAPPTPAPATAPAPTSAAAPALPQSASPPSTASAPATPVLNAASPTAAPSVAPPAGANAATSGAAAAGAPSSAPRGATVTLPGAPSGGGGRDAASGAAGASAPGGARDGALRPGFIDGFDPDAARRNAAREAARDLNARRALVPPSVAPSPTAREREAKAIENAVREDCKEALAQNPNLLAIPIVIAGQLVDKGCRIR